MTLSLVHGAWCRHTQSYLMDMACEGADDS